jgi:hypothetical protein
LFVDSRDAGKSRRRMRAMLRAEGCKILSDAAGRILCAAWTYAARRQPG